MPAPTDKNIQRSDPWPGGPEDGTAAARRLSLVRRRTEEVFGITLDSMLGALEDLGVAEVSLQALAATLRPEAMERLQALQPCFKELGAQLDAKAQRCRAASRSLERSMGDGRSRLDELRRLARTATLVSLNALVVSRSLSSEGGALDGLARTMRTVLGDVSGLVADLAVSIAAGQAELRGVGTGITALAGLARTEALPAIEDFADLIQARARDDRVARTAGLVSRRLRALQDRVGQVIMNLQAGDAFRQRLEHVETILAKAEEVGGPSAAALRGLAAAQLRGALDELGRGSQGAIRHLRVLGRTAADIPRAGAIDALRGGGRDGVIVLVTAAARLGRIAGDLTEANGRLTSASRSLTRALADAGQDAGEAAEFERRMTVLGLNAILLASRLGPEGRAMEAVAQQQREIARGIIAVMAELRRDLEGVVAAAGDLDAPEDEALAAAIHAAAAAAAEVMGLSERLRAHLTMLESVPGSGEIAGRMEHAQRQLEDFVALTTSLEEVASALDRNAARTEEGPEWPALIAEVRSLYSMQSEREVHDGIFPRAEGSDAGAGELQAEEDDVLFA